jgi:hypothetical protein
MPAVTTQTIKLRRLKTAWPLQKAGVGTAPLKYNPTSSGDVKANLPRG